MSHDEAVIVDKGTSREMPTRVLERALLSTIKWQRQAGYQLKFERLSEEEGNAVHPPPLVRYPTSIQFRVS